MTARATVAMPEAQPSKLVEAWARPVVSDATVYQPMPPLAADELAALEKSIVEHGIQVPVIVDEAGNLIDGHHRREIATRLGIDLPVEVRAGLTEAAKHALSVSLNIDRRQLTREQKRGIIAAQIKADPEASDNSIAKTVGVHNETVAAERARLVESGAVTESVTRRDAIGRQQPATKPAPPVERERPAVNSTPVPPPESRTLDAVDRAGNAHADAVTTVIVADMLPGTLTSERVDEWIRVATVTLAGLRKLSDMVAEAGQ